MNKLICPICKNKLNIENELIRNDKSLICACKHCYDIAKEGYINLLNCKTGSGDNEILIKARENFLSKDYYKPLQEKIISLINKYDIKSILDCGCGTGYYTEAFYNDKLDVYGLDISKDAIKIASKKHSKNNRITYFVSSSKNIPLKTESIDCIISIFAPYFDNEFKRILNNNKYLILASCNKEHLYELKKIVYDNPYYNENISKEVLSLESFSLIYEEDLTYTINVNNEDLISLFKMTPYYYKTKENDFNKLLLINNLSITISFKISIFQKK